MICVDANLVVRFLAFPEDRIAWDLWSMWEADSAELIAPLLLRYEVVNALHRYRRLGELNERKTFAIVEKLLKLPIAVDADETLHRHALELAHELGQPAAYDAHYIAVAKRVGADLYTGDRRLAAAAEGSVPRVVYVPPVATP